MKLGISCELELLQEIKGQDRGEVKCTFPSEGYLLTYVRPLSVRRRHTDRRCGVEAHLFYILTLKPVFQFFCSIIITVMSYEQTL